MPTASRKLLEAAAAALFRRYEESHRAKNTVDGQRKAMVNADIATRIEEHLTKTTVIEVGEVKEKWVVPHTTEFKVELASNAEGEKLAVGTKVYAEVPTWGGGGGNV